MESNHIVYRANKEQGNEDCCSDRVQVLVGWVCSCGLHACDTCMKNHIFQLHLSKQLDLTLKY